MSIKGLLISTTLLLLLGAGYLYFSLSRPIFNFFPKSSTKGTENIKVAPEVLAKFNYLSKNGNSSCSSSFRDSIATLPEDSRLQGSCCSPMNLHRYSEQIPALKKYANISEIPPDPYDVQAGLAKMLMSHYDDQLTPEQQKAYDYAMEHSDEKGPCCCKCWRWNVYGGLAKVLVTKYNFTGEQITEVWNLSDGCGGNS